MVGAGETGMPLLKQLIDADFVQVVMVAELNQSLPGIALARKYGLPTTADFTEIASLGNLVDIIIDVTGVPGVRQKLRELLLERNNTHTIIMHETIAILMSSLSQNRLVPMKHGPQEY